MNHSHFNFFVLNLDERSAQRFHRTLNVRFDNDIQFLQFAFFDAAENVIQRYLGGFLLFRFCFGNTFFRYAAGNLFICCIQDITGLRYFVQT